MYILEKVLDDLARGIPNNYFWECEFDWFDYVLSIINPNDLSQQQINSLKQIYIRRKEEISNAN